MRYKANDVGAHGHALLRFGEQTVSTTKAGLPRP
jgi:hypothetical protein